MYWSNELIVYVFCLLLESMRVLHTYSVTQYPCQSARQSSRQRHLQVLITKVNNNNNNHSRSEYKYKYK